MIDVKILFVLTVIKLIAGKELKVASNETRYSIDGKVLSFYDVPNAYLKWQSLTRIHVNGGKYIGFVNRDGYFSVNNIPSGSYVVEVLHPELTFEPVRVEINSKGKFRARKVNHIQTSLISQIAYPLRFKALGKTSYFLVREQWRLTDILMNPMVMVMVFPLILIMVLRRLMNDPETKKDFEQIQKMTKFDMPEMSDVVTNFLSGNNQQIREPSTKDSSRRGPRARRRCGP